VRFVTTAPTNRKANCWPTFSNRRGDLTALWYEAHVALAVAENGGAPLSRMQQILLRRKIGCAQGPGLIHFANEAA
jgi:hypothetical protein